MCQATKVMWQYGKVVEGRTGKSCKEVNSQLRLNQVNNMNGLEKKHKVGEGRGGGLSKYVSMCWIVIHCGGKVGV